MPNRVPLRAYTEKKEVFILSLNESIPNTKWSSYSHRSLGVECTLSWVLATSTLICAGMFTPKELTYDSF